ncbi:MAG: electron transfer flavoprotein subunit alpha/FixB family protein [Ktedonobacterales bacterium]
MSGNIWVVAAFCRGRLLDATYEAVALGRELADNLGTKLEVLLLGHELKDVLGTLGIADAALCVEHVALADPVPDVHAHVVARLAGTRHPLAILVPQTNVTWELGSLVAGELGVPYVNSCTEVRVVEKTLEARTVLYGGKVEANVRTKHAPSIFGLVSGVRDVEKGYADHPLATERITEVDVQPTSVQLRRYLEPEAGDIDISKEDVLVAIGRGIETRDNLEVAKKLADVLGGAICGSRPVIDQGWLPLSRQVGKSGATVRPKLYVAAGISGAPEHVEGMKGSGLIIAINSDPQAPIFQVAHYGIAAKLLDVLPALTEAIRARSRKGMKQYA